jgi:DNA-binding winged helix-turn-helix (wHTH) protein
VSGVLEFHDIVLDSDRHQLSVRGNPVALPLKEFELLEFLMVNAGRVLTRGQIIDRVWGSDYFGDTKTLDVHIKRLRNKIEVAPGEPTIIVTVRGWGIGSRLREREFVFGEAAVKTGTNTSSPGKSPYSKYTGNNPPRTRLGPLTRRPSAGTSPNRVLAGIAIRDSERFRDAFPPVSN